MDLITADDATHLLTFLGFGVATITGIWIAISSTRTKTAVDDSTIAATEAQGSVIELLQKQVERMSVSNEELGMALKQFQLENIALRREISDLHITINTLSEKINLLTLKTV